jgi:hypothetical protein
MSENEKRFDIYLREQAQKRGGGLLSQSSIQSYIQTLFTLSEKLKSEGLIDTSIFNIDDIDKLSWIHRILLDGDYEVSKQNRRQNDILSAALSHYMKMLSLQPEDDDFEEIVRPLAAHNEGIDDLILDKDNFKHVLKDCFNKANLKKEPVLSLQARRDRAKDVRLLTLSRANDRCDLCKHQSFLLPNGHQYLECHHLVYLANNGIDSIINTVALCPNCHRMMHLGIQKERDDSFEKLLHIIYDYMQDEASIESNLPQLFASYFKNRYPSFFAK